MCKLYATLKVVVWAMVVFIAACTHAPLPTGHLGDYTTLQPQPPPCLTVYVRYIPPTQPTRVDHVVQVLPSQWNADRILAPAEEKELLEYLDRRFHLYLHRFAPQPVIVTGSRNLEFFLEAGAAVTRVRLSITRIDKGTAALRPFLGAFGLGATELQIEGTMEDAATRQTLARFARRTRNAGLAYGLMTPQSVRPQFCWKIALDETAELLARYVVLQLKTPPAGWDAALFPKENAAEGEANSPAAKPPS
ncbi:MAG: hypothetical protein N3D11_13490 [Candidatus Sumerlaeia bacterium]|nr:hypothetical protein [Candidatus Sumerlaeia bacterium]